ncbi:MAG: DUF2157 domain-containing protein [Terriglobales bacterium]
MAVSEKLERQLQRWVEAGLLDAPAAGRIRAFEAPHESSRMRWPVVFAIAFGSIMVGAGVLLFVAAHWEHLSPTERFLLVVAMIAGFHLAAGAFMPRLRSLGLALHAVGTVALGGGIFLAAQIFNLQEHWPGGILLWAVGALLSWLVLRDWLQATLAALLVPAWIACEWSLRAERFAGNDIFLTQFMAMMAVTYFSARRDPYKDDNNDKDDDKDDEASYFRRALVWVGGLDLIPTFAVLMAGQIEWRGSSSAPMGFSRYAAGLLLAFALPLLAAWFLRGKAMVWNVAFAVWIFLVGFLGNSSTLQVMTKYLACALAATALVLWGLQEQRRERINLGVAGFAITIIVFYFSSVMGKLGRSASLVAFGLLFLIGGWQLERLRRKLVARASGGAR